jgi:hypothetical protein
VNKECRACHVVKPANEFYGNTQKKDGLSSYCKECTLAKMKAAYVKRPAKPRPPEGMKKCTHCKEVLPVEQFSSNRRNKDGLSYNCRKCDVIIQTEWRRQHPEYHRENSRAYYHKNEENKQRHYENSVRHRIGNHVAHGTYARLFAEQQGKCAICSATKSGVTRASRFHIDHCHTTGKVRGLLCAHCNRLLGSAYDKVEILESAIRYLRKAQEGGG